MVVFQPFHFLTNFFLYTFPIIDVSRNYLFWLPRTFVTLSNLEFCNISRNQFTILDVDFEKMDKLQHFIACFNQISEVPESLPKSSLETLDLYGNKISSISLETMNMNLRRFDVAGNQISSGKFAEFCYLEQYQSLQSNLRSSNFEWEFLIKENYRMDISVLKERIDLETAVCQEQSVTWYNSHKNRNLDLSFSYSVESDEEPLTCESVSQLPPSEVHDKAQDGRLDLERQPPPPCPRTIRASSSLENRTQQVIEIDSQFDDAD